MSIISIPHQRGVVEGSCFREALKVRLVSGDHELGQYERDIWNERVVIRNFRV